MSATTGRRRPRRIQRREFPRVFALLTRVDLPAGELEARAAANGYKRESLRLAFEAGWNTASHPPTWLGVLKSPLMSDLGKAAFYAGVSAQIEATNQPEEDTNG